MHHTNGSFGCTKRAKPVGAQQEAWEETSRRPTHAEEGVDLNLELFPPALATAQQPSITTVPMHCRLGWLNRY